MATIGYFPENAWNYNFKFSPDSYNGKDFIWT